ncbi:MAG: TetR/AcrR family transcriptional regulator [Kouleothrix sp.]|nr:TetR/AcrR family transcriptional regulator [Kouleothrix sp.]
MTSTPLRERRRKLLRDEILLAATELLNEKGYAAMSMDELAGRVGISKPTLYSHFATKEDLIVEAMARGLDQMTWVIQANSELRSPLQQLTFILRTAIQIQIDKGVLSPRPWAPEVFQMLCSHPEVLERLHRTEVFIEGLIQRGRECGEIDSALDPAMVVRTFFVLVNTLHSPFLKVIGTPDPAAIADSLATIFARGVRAERGEQSLSV